MYSLFFVSGSAPLDVCKGTKEMYKRMSCCGGNPTMQSVCTSEVVDVSSIASKKTCLVPNAESELDRLVASVFPGDSYPGFQTSVQREGVGMKDLFLKKNVKAYKNRYKGN